jgi:DNA end-binding protein Ku
VGIGRFVMRTKEYLVTVRPLGHGLALETMFYADEIRDLDDLIPAGVKKAAVSPKEVTLAKQLIESLEGAWEPRRFKDSYRERVLDVIRKKARGEEVVHAAPEEEPSEVVDLMAALKASLSGAAKRPRKVGKNGSTKGAQGRGGRRKKAA